MIYEIKNDMLRVRVSTKGGELRSICDRDGREYLWQADLAFWSDCAPNLFPYIARLTDQSYLYQGKKYHMDIHGFLKDSQLELVECSEEAMVMRLVSSQATLVQYPFAFTLEIQWELKGSALEITYRVMNHDEKIMYFGIGGHPGFHVPLESGLVFEDYYLDFGEKAEPLRVGMTDDCFVTGNDAPYPLSEERCIKLEHSLFDDDAVILRKMPPQATLACAKGGKAIRVEYPDMPYLGIWHMPRTKAPYVCIEPWSSLPSRKGVVEELEKQENLVSLEPGGVYENRWSIIVTDSSRE